MTPTDPRAEILGIIRRINAAWLEAPPRDIVARGAPCLAQDVVDATYSETGHEAIVFAHHDSKWCAVWPAMLPAST